MNSDKIVENMKRTRTINLEEGETNSFDEQVDKFTSLLADTLKKKNADYGDSYGKSVSKYGEVVALIRISDKFNRLDNLILNGTENKVDESIPETLIDLCGYAALEAIRRGGYDE